MKKLIEPSTLLIINVIFSVVLYAGILLPLVIESKINIIIFPIVIVIHNIIIWLFIFFEEKYKLY